jgi:hypothetical protein
MFGNQIVFIKELYHLTWILHLKFCENIITLVLYVHHRQKNSKKLTLEYLQEK